MARTKERVAVQAKLLQYMAAVALLLGGLRLVSQQPAAQGGAALPFTVQDAGRAGKPDVLLIPGLSSGRNVWDAEVVKLAPKYRLHLLQMNGFAGQPAGKNAGSTTLLPDTVEAIHGYLVANRLHPAVVGHSMGGLLALMLAAKHPEDVSKLVIVDALPFYALLYTPEATVEGARPMVAMMRKQIEAVPAEQWTAMQAHTAEMLCKDPAGQKLVAADSAGTDRSVMTEAMVEDFLTDMRPELRSIKTPTLVLYEHDPSLQMPNADSYAQIMQTSYKPMPNARLVQMDGARHFVMLDEPVKFDAEVEAFLR